MAYLLLISRGPHSMDAIEVVFQVQDIGTWAFIIVPTDRAFTTETAAWLACRKTYPLNKPGHHLTCRQRVDGLWTYGEYPSGREFNTQAEAHAAARAALQPSGVRAQSASGSDRH
jgi:hypothetical protein